MIQNIAIDKLKIHPKNVRKNYGGIEELADSIKAKGILQNLTVVPDPDEEGMYLVVIGNRRLTAARVAGIETLPCEVTEMDEKEQASTMLLENMQRENLTIYEEAQGLQMVLDLGETEDGLAEKTGFSKTTIKRRLNIAKLDQEELQKKERDDCFQLSLTDLYALEKIKDIEARNEILRKSDNSRDITARVQREIAEEKKKENTKKYVAAMKKCGIEEAPEKAQQEMYTNKWVTLQTFKLSEEPPEKIEVEKEEKEKIYYLIYWSEIRIIKKVKKEKKEQTPEEKKKAERDSKRKKISAIAKSMEEDRRIFALDVIAGKIPRAKDEESVRMKCWKLVRDLTLFVGNSSIGSFMAGEQYYNLKQEQRDEIQEKIERLSDTELALVCACLATSGKELTAFDGTYNKKNGEYLSAVYEILECYGFAIDSNEEAQVMNGTHELYEENK